jgi:hypothetical protein
VPAVGLGNLKLMKVKHRGLVRSAKMVTPAPPKDLGFARGDQGQRAGCIDIASVGGDTPELTNGTIEERKLGGRDTNDHVAIMP